LKELWALMNFILPELFDDVSVFEEEIVEELTAKELEFRNIELIKKLHQILRPFLLKRTKAVIDKTIPPKKEIHLYVGLS
jgi:SWI/SNF-related matrix-associated actin-dependent regulator of chromatin subfamily A member 5